MALLRRWGTRALLSAVLVFAGACIMVPAVQAAQPPLQIYWSNLNAGTIGRANLDGTGANQSFINLGLGARVFGLAVDSQHIYWTDPDSGLPGLQQRSGRHGQPRRHRDQPEPHCRG